MTVIPSSWFFSIINKCKNSSKGKLVEKYKGAKKGVSLLKLQTQKYDK